MPKLSRQSRFHLLLAVAGGLTLAAAVAIALTILWLRADAIEDATRDSENLATVLGRQLENSVQAIDLVLTEIRTKEELRARQQPTKLDQNYRENTYRMLMERRSRLWQAEFIAMVDQSGDLVSTTRQWPTTKINVFDRPYFQHLMQTNQKGVYISTTLRDRVKGLPVIIFSQQINGANNEFLGAVVVGVRLAYFQHIYESIASLSDQSFLLLHRDGTVIVRFPDPKDRAYIKMPVTSPWYPLVKEGGGQYRSPGYFDGVPRYVAVHPLRDYAPPSARSRCPSRPSWHSPSSSAWRASSA